MSKVVHRVRRIKEIATWAALVVFGIGALIGGIVMLNSHGEVDCGGKKMGAGDTCVTTGKHGSTTRSADEQQSKNTKTAWSMIVLGPLFSAGGAFMLRSELRKSKGPAGGGMQVPTNNPQAPQANPGQWPAPAHNGAAQPYPGHPQPGPAAGPPNGYPQQPPVPANHPAPQQNPMQPAGYPPAPQYGAPQQNPMQPAGYPPAPQYAAPQGYPQYAQAPGYAGQQYAPPPGYGPPQGYPQHQGPPPGYPQPGPHNQYPPQR